jgi:hypothetical protein
MNSDGPYVAQVSPRTGEHTRVRARTIGFARRSLAI